MVRSNEFNDFNNDIASCFDRDRLEHDLLEFYKFTSPHRPRWGDSGLFAYPHINVEDESVEFSIMSMNEDESMGNTTMNTFDREFIQFPLCNKSKFVASPWMIPEIVKANHQWKYKMVIYALYMFDIKIPDC